MLYLIEILHQTTTNPTCQKFVTGLYLIEILHQTTTASTVLLVSKVLYLIEILHQTTTRLRIGFTVGMLYLIEILHQTTTASIDGVRANWLYLIEILHQTTTIPKQEMNLDCCILSKFYIKPQLQVLFNGEVNVVSYRNSTSNHNPFGITRNVISLYLIEILHQTTTSGLILIDKVLLTGCLPL